MGWDGRGKGGGKRLVHGIQERYIEVFDIGIYLPTSIDL